MFLNAIIKIINVLCDGILNQGDMFCIDNEARFTSPEIMQHTGDTIVLLKDSPIETDEEEEGYTNSKCNVYVPCGQRGILLTNSEEIPNCLVKEGSVIIFNSIQQITLSKSMVCTIMPQQLKIKLNDDKVYLYNPGKIEIHIEGIHNPGDTDYANVTFELRKDTVFELVNNFLLPNVILKDKTVTFRTKFSEEQDV